jgi:hypothetical protein
MSVKHPLSEYVRGLVELGALERDDGETLADTTRRIRLGIRSTRALAKNTLGNCTLASVSDLVETGRTF